MFSNNNNRGSEQENINNIGMEPNNASIIPDHDNIYLFRGDSYIGGDCMDSHIYNDNKMKTSSTLLYQDNFLENEIKDIRTTGNANIINIIPHERPYENEMREYKNFRSSKYEHLGDIGESKNNCLDNFNKEKRLKELKGLREKKLSSVEEPNNRCRKSTNKDKKFENYYYVFSYKKNSNKGDGTCGILKNVDLSRSYKREWNRHGVCMGEEQTSSCNLCKRVFKRLSFLKLHIFSHLTSVNIFKCPSSSCSKMFKGYSVAFNHILSSHHSQKDLLINILSEGKWAYPLKCYLAIVDFYKLLNREYENQFLGAFCMDCFTFPVSLSRHPCSRNYANLRYCPACEKNIDEKTLKEHCAGPGCKRTLPTIK